jgi:hypothetical protein
MPSNARARVIGLAILRSGQERLDLGAGVDQAGPDRCRELRTAIAPPAISATSTQLPLGLLAVLLRQCAYTKLISRNTVADLHVSPVSHQAGKENQRGRVS